MRNLKKVLSLALALVMLVGMMVVGAGAASFKDAASITHKEAVDVVSGLEVLLGDETGNFNPQGNLTRAQAATVIAKLDLGAAFGNLVTTNASSFSDVAANYWGKPYIDYCAARGLILGVGGGRYDPEASVTGVQFALMVCRVLGYEDANERITGANWETAAAALARKAGLTNNVALSSQPMTRDDMAQVAFNALQADMVEYDGRAISINGVYIPAGVAKARDEGNVCYNNDTDDGKLQLCEEKFPKLALDTTAQDDNGRVSNVWTYGDDNVIASIPQDATHTLKGNFTSKALYNALGRTVVGSIGAGASNRTLNVYVDGVALTGSTTPQLTQFKSFLDAPSATAKVSDVAGDGNITAGNGTVTEIYVSDDEVNVCVINTYAGNVSKVTAAKDDDPRTVTVATMDYETEDFEKSDVVLFTKGYSDVENAAVITSMSLAERVEGAVTKVTTGTSFVVDGTTYKYSATFGDAKISAIGDAAFYLDNEGNVIKIGELTASKDYAYVIKTTAEEGRYGGYSCYARLLLTDGSVEEVTLDNVPSGVTSAVDESTADIALDTAYEGRIVSYTVDDDKYSLTDKSGAALAEAKGLKITTGVATVTLTAGNLSADSNTVFLVKNSDNTYSAYKGYRDVPNIAYTDTNSKIVSFGETGKAKDVIYVEGSTVENSSASDVIFIRANKDASVITEKGKEYREFDAIVAGEATKIQVAEAALGGDCAALIADVNNGKIYAVSSLVYNSKDLVTKYNAYPASSDSNVGYVDGTGTVAPANTVVGLGGTSHAWDEDVVVGKWENSAMSVITIGDIETDTNDTVVVVLDKGATVVGAFVTKVAGNPGRHSVNIPAALSGTPTPNTAGKYSAAIASNDNVLGGSTVTVTVTATAAPTAGKDTVTVTGTGISAATSVDFVQGTDNNGDNKTLTFTMPADANVTDLTLKVTHVTPGDKATATLTTTAIDSTTAKAGDSLSLKVGGVEVASWAYDASDAATNTGALAVAKLVNDGSKGDWKVTGGTSIEATKAGATYNGKAVSLTGTLNGAAIAEIKATTASGTDDVSAVVSYT